MNKITKVDIGLLIIRLGFAARLIYGTVDNIFSWPRMLEFKSFLETHHFPIPLVCAILSVYLQFFAGLSWIIGWKVRISSALMIINFLVAIFGIHLMNGDSYLATAPAIHLGLISILLFLTGAGQISLDGRNSEI